MSPDASQIAYVLAVPRRPLEEDDGASWAELHVVGRDGVSRPFLTGEVNVSEISWTPDGKADRVPGQARQGRGALAVRDPGGGRGGPPDRGARDGDHVLRLQPRRQARRVSRQGGAAEGAQGPREEGLHAGGRGREREARPDLGAPRPRMPPRSRRCSTCRARRRTCTGARSDRGWRLALAPTSARGRRADGAAGRDRGRRLGRGHAHRQPGQARPDGLEHGRRARWRSCRPPTRTIRRPGA